MTLKRGAKTEVDSEKHPMLLLFLHVMILQNYPGNLCRKSTFRLTGPPGEWLRNYWQVRGAGPIVAWYRANMTDVGPIYSQRWWIIWDICDFVNRADYRQIPLNTPSGGILSNGILLGKLTDYHHCLLPNRIKSSHERIQRIMVLKAFIGII